MKKHISPVISLIISMLICGTLAPFVRNIPLPSSELALYRAVLAAMMIGAVLLVKRSRKDIPAIKKEIPLLLASGAALGINWILLFEAYKHTTVSTATLCYYAAPILVTAICPFLFKEKLGGLQLICFIMSTIGVGMIIGTSNFSGNGGDIAGVLLGLAAAVFYAAVVIMNKFIKLTEGLHRTLLQFLAAIVVLVPYTAFTGGFHLMSLDLTGWSCLLVVGLLHTGVTYLLYFGSLAKISGQQAAILSYIDPLTAVVISVTILGEAISLWQIIGGILIIGFAALNEKAAAHNAKEKQDA